VSRPRKAALGTLAQAAVGPQSEGISLHSDALIALELRYDEDGDEVRVEVTGENFLIGRGPSCSLILTDESVSRRHAQISWSAKGWTISDLGSKNGIKVNTYRAVQQLLHDGDRIDVAGVRLYVRMAAQGQTARANVVFETDDTRRHTEVFDVARLDSLLGTPESPKLGESSPLIAVSNDFDDAEPGLRLFSDAAESLISCDSLDETLERILELVFDNLPAERGVICLYDEENEETSPQVMRTREGSSHEPIRISSHIANDVITRKQSLLVNDPLRDERFGGAESVIMLNIRSAMCAPLYRRGRVIGFVYVDRQSTQDPFTTTHLHALSTLGILSAVAVEQASLRDGLRREQDIRTRLARYSSPAVVDRIVSDSSESATMSTEEADVTVVFADLTGFTTMAETLEPGETVRVLNQVFERMTEAIFEFEGTLDKFRGDGLMAFFGAPLHLPDHAQCAVAAAVRMQELLAELNSYSEDRQLQMRIGINSGNVVVGDIGSPQRKDYTVIGDMVNTASRLESSVALPGEVVIGEETWRRVRGRFDCEPLEPARLKGKRKLVQPYKVLGPIEA
jgi:adenylate cyclase